MTYFAKEFLDITVYLASKNMINFFVEIMVFWLIYDII